MPINDVVLPKLYLDDEVLFESHLDAWRLAAQDGFAKNKLNLTQFIKDVFSVGYQFDNDGQANKPKSLEDKINDLTGGGVSIFGTASSTFTINSLANALILSAAGLTAPHTFTFPNFDGTVLVDHATQQASNKTFLDNLVFRSGTAFSGTFDHANTLNRVWALPDLDGTVLLHSAIQLVSNKTFTDDLVFRSGTAFDGVFSHNNSALQNWGLPDATGNIPVLPTQATTETGSGDIVRANNPLFSQLRMNSSRIYLDGGTDTYIQESPSGFIKVFCNNVETMSFGQSGNSAFSIQLDNSGTIATLAPDPAPTIGFFGRKNVLRAWVSYKDNVGIIHSHNLSGVSSDDGDGFYTVTWNLGIPSIIEAGFFHPVVCSAQGSVGGLHNIEASASSPTVVSITSWNVLTSALQDHGFFVGAFGS